jgi:CRISPR/Cas system-associated exonuclease Cas4 (RecB family)
MSTIFHVMKEEYDRLIEADLAYRHNIEKMPHGAPRIKNIHNRNYLYLARRKGVKVIYDYIGAADSEKAKDTLVQVDRRKRFEALLKDIHRNLKDVKKVLRGKI